MIIADTHEVITTLQAKGFDKDQAEGITDALRKIDLSGMATKQDITKVVRRLTKVQNALVIRFIGLLIAQSAFLLTVILIFVR